MRLRSVRIVLIISLLLLTGCSGEYHKRLAYRKGALTDSTRTDTVTTSDTITSIDTIRVAIPPDTLTRTDTIECDSAGKASIRRGGGSDNISFTLLDNLLTTTAVTDSLEHELEVERQRVTTLTNQITNTTEVHCKPQPTRWEWVKAGIVGWGIGNLLIIIGYVLLKIVLKSRLL